MSSSLPTPQPTMPWWRVRMVWLVIGGPLAVVVASFVTLGLAISHPDPVLATGADVGAGTPADAARAQALMPAVAARNHAAQPPVPR